MKFSRLIIVILLFYFPVAAHTHSWVILKTTQEAMEELQPRYQMVEWHGRLTRWKVERKYSNKDFTARTLQDQMLDGMTIYGSCFAQEADQPVHVFPDGVRDLTIINSNLHGVFIPEGVTVIGGTR